MEIKVNYLQYCGKCQELKEGLKSWDVEYIDADVDIIASDNLEQLVGTKNYPIVEVKVGTEVIFFVAEDDAQAPLSGDILVEYFQTIPELINKLNKLK